VKAWVNCDDDGLWHYAEASEHLRAGFGPDQQSVYLSAFGKMRVEIPIEEFSRLLEGLL